MLVETPGIVLSTLKYRESSVITRIYTRELGTQSYVVNGVRTAKARMAPSLFEPLTQLQLLVYHKHGQELHRIKEVHCHQPYQQMPLHPAKTAIRFFLAEVCGRLLPHDHSQPVVYSFLEQALLILDLLPSGVAAFPVQFMLKLSQIEGFSPANAHDLLDHLAHPPSDVSSTDMQHMAQILVQSLTAPFGEAEAFCACPPAQRRQMLELVIDFWRYHLQADLQFRSLPVLQQILV